MSQGPRRGWVRAACAGLGAVLCAGAVGCNTAEKDAPPKLGGPAVKQPGTGLPGTPTLPGQPPASGVGAANRGAPSQFGVPGQPAANGVQSAGGFGTGMTQPGGRVNQPGTVTGGGSSLVPPVGPAGPGGTQSGAGWGNMPQPSMGGTHTQSNHTSGTVGGGHAMHPLAPSLSDPAGLTPPAPPGGPAGPIPPPSSGAPRQPGNVGTGGFGGQ